MSNSELPFTDYNSRVLPIYLGRLGRYPDAHCLDLGPVCEENIMFFAKMSRTFSVCDMFSRLDRSLRRGLRPEKVWHHLDYRPHSFNGINLWDLINHLDDNEAERMAELCHTMLKPAGMLMIISFEEQRLSGPINSFVIQHDGRLILRVQPHLDLPWYYRDFSKLISLLRAFTLVKSFLYRNGIRELLFSREP